MFRQIGHAGTNVITRLTAFILLAIGVEIVWGGLKPLILALWQNSRPVARLPLGRHRAGALVVEHLADAGLLLGRQLGVVDREVGADRHALLHRRPRAQSPRTSA